MTIYDRLERLAAGEEINWDLALLTDGIDAEGIREITEQVNEVKDASHVRVIIDHDTPSGTSATAARQKELKNFALRHGISYNYGGGIAYHQLMEDNIPAGTVLIGCGDHIAAVGAKGAIGITLTPAEMAEALRSGRVQRPESRLITLQLTGSFSCFTAAKDLAFSLLQDEAYKASSLCIEDKEEALGFTERVTICSLLSTHCRSVVFRTEANIEAEEEIGANKQTGERALFCDIRTLDLSTLEPKMLPPGSDDPIPASETDGLRVNQVFIGGCAGGTIEALREVAAIWQGRKVSPYVRVMVAPATSKVYEQAIEEGLIETFMESNVLVMNQGCSACWGQSQGRCSEKEVFATTGSINCSGWCGARNNGIWIVSPRQAAEAALTGTLYEF